MAILGVVPAAGLATRLQPLPCSKELLRVGGAPVVDRLVAQLRAGGADTVRLVTRLLVRPQRAAHDQTLQGIGFNVHTAVEALCQEP